ncbi:MAG: hypothetical protein RIS36_2105 [Pseudomonadota bacterium]
MKRESYNQPAIKLPVLSKEYGATVPLEEMMSDSISELEKLFPSEWQHIVIAAYARLVSMHGIRTAHI